ncbi:GNAT family N-acetyltransferase [Micropruina sp.]|uniref:GNAT family N-acetyltransferase n=1 Tax=Micropruina sp. TaxID=2737536 RepID=UPI0039E24F9F
MTHGRTLADAFPVLGLRVTAGPVELRGIDDDTLLELAELAAQGVHTFDAMPFLMPWTLAPADRFHRQYLQYHWGVRSRFGSEAWSLDLAVRHEGELVGTQGVATHDFLLTRSGETGSWLGLRHQGKGIGTLMRQTMCALLFDHLGFERVESAAWVDNAASNAVSRKVGYRPNGIVRKPRPLPASSGEPGRAAALEQRYLLEPADLVRGPDLQVEGVDALRGLIGLPVG